MKLTVLLLAALAVAAVDHASTANVSSYLSLSDKARLKLVFANAFESKELNSIHYAISGYSLLGEKTPNPQDKCNFILSSVSGNPSIEAIYYATSSWKTLGTCSGSLPKKFNKDASDVVQDDSSSIVDLYYAVHVLQNLNDKVQDPKKLVKQVQAALKKDDSLLNMGYAFHIAAALGPQDGKFAFERIEDAVVQADEVDGKFLQFEGGLSITALIVSGAYRLSDVVGKAPPVTNIQAVKFANYFLSRKSVQLPKGAFHLLQVLKVFTENKFHIPVCMTLAGGRSLTPENPKVQVRVSDVLGQVLPFREGKLPSVMADSATRMVGPTQDIGSPVPVLSGKQFSPVNTDRTLYELDLFKEGNGVERGFYDLVVSVGGPSVDPRLVGSSGARLSLKVLGPVSLEAAEIGTADADQTTAPKLTKLSHPNKLANVVEADRHQKLMLRFTLRDVHSNKISLAHQAFVRLTNLQTSQEIVFVAEPDQSKAYRFDMDVSGRAGDFNHLSGKYSLDLVIGDATISNAISWKVADVQLKFSDVQASDAQEVTQNPYLPRPEIVHLFREPERRPPVMVSNLFTGLVCVPVIILLGLWLKLGVNISGFPISLSALGFHAGLGGIFVLFGIFWLKLNMFQTLKYLIGVGIVTFLCGNKMLSKIASERKH